MFDVILVPLDGSELAEATLPYATAIQRAFGSRLLLLRVVGRREGAKDCVEWRLSQAEARSYVEGVAERLAEEGTETEAIVTTGKPSEAILETARERGADLVAITSHGAGGASPFEVSGTAHKVLSSGDLSVLLVRMGEGARTPEENHLKRILVPMDGSARSEWALRLAAAVARSSGAELLLLQVLTRPQGVLPPKEQVEMSRLLEASRTTAADRLDEWGSRLERSDLPIRSEVMVAPSVPRAIDEVAMREDASLVILSAHGTTASDAWPYGSVSGSVLQHGTTPVLILQDAPARFQEEGAQRPRWKASRPDTAWTT